MPHSILCKIIMIKNTNSEIFLNHTRNLRLFIFLALAILIPSHAMCQETEAILLQAARIFDGKKFRHDVSILVKDGKIAKVYPPYSVKPQNVKVMDLGDATLLPGFIELHAHLTFRNVSGDVVLKHGITTIRDLGGPVHRPYGGKGTLRVITSGPIITAPKGYPIPNLGSQKIAIPVSTEDEARKTVRDLVKGGAVVIKIALEPGGERGAPWSHSHGHVSSNPHATENRHHHHQSTNKSKHSKQGWPLLSENIVKSIVEEAHNNGRKVVAHVSEEKGVQIALDADVDEWAHVPCNAIQESLLKRALAKNVKIVSTLDTLSKCSGVAQNSAKWKLLGGELLYGAEIAHPDIPWGIDTQELVYLMQMAQMELIDVLRAATSKAGQHLGFPLLGTLQDGAPADIIAVKGDPTKYLKILEYPDLVISGGEIVVNNF